MNIFNDKTPMTPDVPKEASVGTALTNAQRRAEVSATFPRYDAMDVHNRMRPRFGHDT